MRADNKNVLAGLWLSVKGPYSLRLGLGFGWGAYRFFLRGMNSGRNFPRRPANGPILGLVPTEDHLGCPPRRVCVRHLHLAIGSRRRILSATKERVKVANGFGVSSSLPEARKQGIFETVPLQCYRIPLCLLIPMISDILRLI